ncbi:Regulatory protein PHO2 [Cyberlindnera fabianii]|uniref:Regulatory protein PHO2 n=1 Tax=Cyberlindnera fabianii TaxID=36022 RepID=A0A1V2L8N3_CYBFA|nr:Regulatory protein PHO2 [Cyberlindnera fabianii]
MESFDFQDQSDMLFKAEFDDTFMGNLSNLSPQSINEIMTNSTDLMLIISKKNFEINYFFSAITDNSKILFRIFYPISSVNDCSISFAQDAEGKEPSCELKIHLNKPPKFAVSFSHLIVQNNNQWSICDDFSEGHQVNDAFIGGSGIPHVFSGLEQSLKFMNSFILDYNSTNVAPAEFELPRPDSRSPTRFPISLARPVHIDDDLSPEGQMSSAGAGAGGLGSSHSGLNHSPMLEPYIQDTMDFDKFIQHPDGDQSEVDDDL